jgi:hypothetical protein
MATVAGWGSIKYGDTPPDQLREVDVIFPYTKKTITFIDHSEIPSLCSSKLSQMLPAKGNTCTITEPE